MSQRQRVPVESLWSTSPHHLGEIPDTSRKKSQISGPSQRIREWAKWWEDAFSCRVRSLRQDQEARERSTLLYYAGCFSLPGTGSLGLEEVCETKEGVRKVPLTTYKTQITPQLKGNCWLNIYFVKSFLASGEKIPTYATLLPETLR